MRRAWRPYRHAARATSPALAGEADILSSASLPRPRRRRGTMRSMVEGALVTLCDVLTIEKSASRMAPLPSRCRVPPPPHWRGRLIYRRPHGGRGACDVVRCAHDREECVAHGAPTVTLRVPPPPHWRGRLIYRRPQAFPVRDGEGGPCGAWWKGRL